MIEIPHQALSDDALWGVIDEYITRESGVTDGTLESKRTEILRQLAEKFGGGYDIHLGHGHAGASADDADNEEDTTLDLDPGLELPTDTSVAIRTAGILGDQFLALEPGAEEEFLRSGDEIAYTEDALSLERLIGKFVNNAGLE